MSRYSNTIKRKLKTIINEMHESRHLFVKNPGKDFTRQRKLSFNTMLTILLQMEGKSLNMELTEFFSKKVNGDEILPTTSAFVQQRSKIKLDAFRYLFTEFTASYTRLKRYKGFRLLAIDGSNFNIAHNPSDKETFRQNCSNSRGYNLLHLNAIYDLENKLYVDALVQPISQKSERQALVEMVDNSDLSEPIILIADRGYEGFNTIAHIEEKGWNYLIRVKDITSRGMVSKLDLPTTEEFDVWYDLTLTRKKTKEINANPARFKTLAPTTRFDYFNDELFYPISFRLVRFKLPNGTYETIITNLKQTVISSKEIKVLYHKRWGIETSFRELKYAIGLSNFHAEKVEFIEQEIFARLTMYNFCSMITMNVVIKQRERKYDYKVNFTMAVFNCRLFFKSPRIKVENLIQQYILPIRQGRTAERRVTPKRYVTFNYRF